MAEKPKKCPLGHPIEDKCRMVVSKYDIRCRKVHNERSRIWMRRMRANKSKC